MTDASLKHLQTAGLLSVGSGCWISPWAILDPEDLHGDKRAIELADGVRVGHGAILYGGVRLGEASVVEEHAVVGKPEYGYAIGRYYSGAGAATEVGAAVMIRAGAVVYGDVHIGDRTTIGHHTTIRTGVTIGEDSQLAHRMTVERGCRIGSSVRCSPGSHITSEVVVEDRVFIGAGVVTVNDKGMVWRQPDREPELLAPYFERGAKIGSGSSVAAGVRIGREALVGTGSVVLRDVPAYAVAYGVPATVRGTTSRTNP